ncbi:mechanosensitive ion channel domain-containing protein [Puerhibacterium puerhi]|uniref:mechanosensitive ion channel domain-containing protein n=1 Tax=Puerhibacterium puerhi TaxID=2692623 RepID=UPI002E2A4246|nr:mechanosensitive ion channel domain-containing protein [Puerhibacterium puerhi]
MPADMPSDSELEATASLGVTFAWALAGVAAAFLLATVLSVTVRRIGRRSPLAREMSLRMRRPTRALLMVVAVGLAVRYSADPDEPWLPALQHLLLIAGIVAFTWVVGAFAFVVEDRVLARVPLDVADNRHARRLRTQVTIVRRLTVAVLVVCGAAAVLLTFPEARAAGASLFASAGLLSIVAGLAAQTSLANVFAGMQIAFTDAIRVDDVVVLEGEWGRIEEITLTYVVVHVWDDRRLILPSTYFTSTPFQNWTRRSAELLGTVELDLDFQVSFRAMRAELDRLLARTELWDQRVGILQVTDAVGGMVRVRVLVSAADAPTLFDLRCFVREGLVEWLQREAPHALPRTRLEGAPQGGGFLAEPALPRLEGAAAAAPESTAGRAEGGVGEGAEHRADAHADVDGARVGAAAAAERPAGQAPGAAAGAEPGERPERRHEHEPRTERRRTPARRSVRVRVAPQDGGSSPATPEDPTVLVPPPSSRRRADHVPGAVPESAAAAMAAGETVLLGAVEAPAARVPAADDGGGAERSALFTGSVEAVERSRAFSGPSEEVVRERELRAERDPTVEAAPAAEPADGGTAQLPRVDGRAPRVPDADDAGRES